MFETIKNLIAFICAVMYSPFLFFVRKKPYRIVLFYHGIKKDDVGNFIRQVSCLAGKTYKVVRVSEIKTAHVNDEKAIVGITFDDAFMNVMENAVPVLKEHKLPAAIFVSVGNFGQKPHWDMPKDCPDKYETVMNEEQVRQLDKEGFEIFSHTLSHPVLTEIQDSSLDVEMIESKEVLERIIGHEVIGISYPYGSYDTRVCKAAEKAGYKLGFTIEPDVVDRATNCLEIGRVGVSSGDSLLKFKLKLTGAYKVCTHIKVGKKLIRRFLETIGGN